jgi:hypothetical protein
MPATLRDQLISTQLFKVMPPTRSLSHESAVDATMSIRVVLSFDCFGDMTGIESMLVDKSVRDIVAQNRRALGLPPQENP